MDHPPRARCRGGHRRPRHDARRRAPAGPPGAPLEPLPHVDVRDHGPGGRRHGRAPCPARPGRRGPCARPVPGALATAPGGVLRPGGRQQLGPGAAAEHPGPLPRGRDVARGAARARRDDHARRAERGVRVRDGADHVLRFAAGQRLRDRQRTGRGASPRRVPRRAGRGAGHGRRRRCGGGGPRTRRSGAHGRPPGGRHAPHARDVRRRDGPGPRRRPRRPDLRRNPGRGGRRRPRGGVPRAARGVRRRRRRPPRLARRQARRPRAQPVGRATAACRPGTRAGTRDPVPGARRAHLGRRRGDRARDRAPGPGAARRPSDRRRDRVSPVARGGRPGRRGPGRVRYGSTPSAPTASS